MTIAEQWALLGIAPTDDKREVRRAYSRLLKQIDVDADPAGFVRLREAMEAALAWGTATPFWEQEEAEAEAEAFTDGGVEAWLDPDGTDGEGLAGPWQPWRPEVAGLGDGSVARLCGELESELFGEGPLQPDTVARLGASILADPELAHVDRLAAAERWMASTIAAAVPRSDPLIVLAGVRFGWGKQREGWQRDYDLEQVHARRRALIFLEKCLSADHPHHRAVTALSGPPPARVGPLRLGLAGDVRDFLALIERNHPTLEHDLDPAALAWWRNYFMTPHLPRHFWLWLCVVPPVLVFFAALALAGTGADPPLPVVAAGAVAITLAGILAWSHLAAAVRERERRVEQGEAGVPATARLAGAALVLPVAAALLPSSWPVIAATTAAGLALGLASLLRCWSDAGRLMFPESRRPRIFLPIVAALASLFLLIALPPLAALKLAAPLAALCWLGVEAYDATRVHLLEGPPGERRLALVAGLAGALLAAMAVAALMGSPQPQAIMVLIPLAIVAAHLASSAATIDVHIAEWPLRVAILILYLTMRSAWPGGFGLGGLIVAGCYGVAYALIRLGFALKEELRPPLA